jgi:hypothetical protein
MMSDTVLIFKPTSRQSLWVRNSEDSPIVLCLEPWGDELLISKDSDYLVILEGPEGEYPGVQWSKERVSVFGWSGSVASVFLEGKMVLSCPTQVPEMPT